MNLDLFAGPGGWEVGAHPLEVTGIENDPDVCLTRVSAGHDTIEDDVAELTPGFFDPVDLLLASPPCQAWSRAGKQDGLLDLDLIYDATRRIALVENSESATGYFMGRFTDPRAALVTEPLRWVLALRPRLVAWEQVPPVLDYWQMCRDILRERGYWCWAGLLAAERYGVPQTRRRAVLMASLDGPVEPPRPTHQAYVPGEPRWSEPQLTLEGQLLPWISMADALDWGMTERPYPVIASGRTTGGPDKEKVGGSDARATLYDEQAAGRWKLRQSALENATERGADEPAPTITGAKDFGEREWLPNDDQLGLKGDDWPHRRPATSIAGDPRAFQPGGHHANDGRQSNPERDGRSQNTIRLSISEAAALQGFPADYPWRGSMTKQFQQVGNAVPPPLARAVIAALQSTRVDSPPGNRAGAVDPR